MQTPNDTSFPGRAILALAAIFSVSMAAAGQNAKPAQPHHMPAGSAPTMTKAQKITNATSAAPSTISAKATVLDWPAEEGAQPTVLRQGTNGWTCLPDMPDSMGNDPMCLDKPWMKWVEGYMSKKAPDVGGVGVGYMTAPGGGWGSNTDPYAMKETSDNQWGHHAPHLMVVVPDTKSLAGISTDPNNGGPYVMFAGTPYAHIMAPLRSTTMTHK